MPLPSDVRYLTRADFPSVLALSKERIQDGFLNAKELGNYLLSPLLGALVLVKKSEVIGYVLYRKDAEEAEIDEIALRTSEEGKGMGTYLLLALLDSLRDGKRKTCFLEVREGNTKARRLYEKNGFVPYRRRKDYYPGEDGICYRKEL